MSHTSGYIGNAPRQTRALPAASPTRSCSPSFPGMTALVSDYGLAFGTVWRAWAEIRTRISSSSDAPTCALSSNWAPWRPIVWVKSRPIATFGVCTGRTPDSAATCFSTGLSSAALFEC